MYEINYYEDLKEIRAKGEDCSSYQLLTASGEFLWKNMGIKVLVLALLLTLIPIFPYLLNKDLASYYFPAKLEDLLAMKQSPAYIWSNFIAMILQAYFVFSFFARAKNFKGRNASASLFLKGLSKVICLSILAIFMVGISTLILGFLLAAMGFLGSILFWIFVLAIGVFFQLLLVSIMDDPRIRMGDMWDRVLDVLKEKHIWFKLLFASFINAICNLTTENIAGLFDGPAKIYASVIADFASKLISLFILGFIVSSFIFYSDHVKYYLPKAFAGDYGKDEDADKKAEYINEDTDNNTKNISKENENDEGKEEKIDQ